MSMDKSNKPIYSEADGLEALRKGLEMQRQKQRLQMRFGGVVSLKSLWSAICPEKLKRIKGHTAVIKAKECENGLMYLYIEISYIDNEYEELILIKDHSYLEEGDRVDIFSIVAIFVDDDKGNTIVRYDAKCTDENESFDIGEIKSDIIHRCSDIMMESIPEEMSIMITFEGGMCHPIQYGILKGNDGITIYAPYPFKRQASFSTTLKNKWNLYPTKWYDYDESDSWYTRRIIGYKNARPLTHGLILAENSDSKYNILNADGSVLCKNIDMLDYGPNYLICNCHLYWINKKNNLWEEIVLPTPLYNKQRERVKLNDISLTKIQIDKDDYFYLYDCSMMAEEYEFDAGGGNGDWWPQYEICHKGIIDKNGSWKVKPSENIKKIESCYTTIIIHKKDKVILLDSNKTSGGLLKEITTIEKCEIKYGKYLLLMKNDLQGVYDAETCSWIIPCCINSKYTLKPNTIRNGLIGVFEIVDRKRGKHKYQEKKYYYLDFQGNIVIEIENGWVIKTGFQDGKATISMTDNYRGEFHQKVIDIDGNTISEHYESFHGILNDYYEDEMRNIDRDNWDAMTDGQYGDYTDDGYDGDYESLGY